MRQNIPAEALEMMRQFEAEEEAKRTARAFKKENSKGKDPFESKVITSGEALALAREYGLIIETGHGKHGIHLVAPDEQCRCAVPYHGEGEDLSKGVTRVILRFIREHGSKEENILK